MNARTRLDRLAAAVPHPARHLDADIDPTGALSALTNAELDALVAAYQARAAGRVLTDEQAAVIARVEQGQTHRGGRDAASL